MLSFWIDSPLTCHYMPLLSLSPPFRVYNQSIFRSCVTSSFSLVDVCRTVPIFVPYIEYYNYLQYCPYWELWESEPGYCSIWAQPGCHNPCSTESSLHLQCADFYQWFPLGCFQPAFSSYKEHYSSAQYSSLPLQRYWFIYSCI